MYNQLIIFYAKNQKIEELKALKEELSTSTQTQNAIALICLILKDPSGAIKHYKDASLYSGSVLMASKR